MWSDSDVSFDTFEPPIFAKTLGGRPLRFFCYISTSLLPPAYQMLFNMTTHEKIALAQEGMFSAQSNKKYNYIIK